MAKKKVKDWIKKHKDMIPGGEADKKKPSDFDPKQLKIGTNHEMEHTNDPKKAREIAMDHLVEDPKYYVKLKRIEKSEYPKSGKQLGCGKKDLAGKICRHNVSRTNPKKFVKDFKKSYNYRDTQVIVDEKAHQAAENASSDLIKYIKASLDGDITSIPFAKGTLTMNQKDKGLYNGFFQDRDGQVVDRFENSTVEMVAKNMEVKDLYSDVAPSHDPVEEAEDRAIAHEEAANTVAAAMNHHNREYHQGQEPGEPINGGKTHIRLRAGNVEIEIKKSLNAFVKSFNSRDQKKHSIKKAVSSWRRNHGSQFKTDAQAAKELMENWDDHRESFNQVLFAIEQLKKSRNGKV